MHTKGVLGKWLTFLVLAKIASVSVVFGAPSDEIENRVSIGIKAGVPLTDFVKPYLSYQVDTKRYVIGPVVDFRIWRNWSIETGAMHKRVYQQAQVTYVIVPATDEEGTNGVLGHYGVSAVGRSWEFPAAGQYHFSWHEIRPYAEGGLSYNHLTSMFRPSTLFVDPQGPPARQPISRTGFLLGAGAGITLHSIHVTPGLRYTRYKEHAVTVQKGLPFEFPLPSSNSVDFLVGFTF